jgi:hypothetical protein
MRFTMPALSQTIYPRYISHDVPVGSVIAGGFLSSEIVDNNALITLPDGSGKFGTSLGLIKFVAQKTAGDTLCLILRGAGERDNGKGNKPSPTLVIATYAFNPETDGITAAENDVLVKAFNALEYDKEAKKTLLAQGKATLPTYEEAIAAGWLLSANQIALLQPKAAVAVKAKGKVNVKAEL